MRLNSFLLGVCCLGFFCACSDDDDRDDTILDMSNLTGKDWYYNAWLGDKYSFGAPDLLEILRFEKGGTLKTIDFSGRREYTIGKWVSSHNTVTLKPDRGEEILWNVQNSGNDYIKTIVNGQGMREYSTDLGYLGELTADAFLVNEYTSGNQQVTYIDADVRGNMNVREGALILSSGRTSELQSREYYWQVKTPDYITFNGRNQEVRFYLRLGKDKHLKLSDSIYAENLPVRLPVEVDLNAAGKDGGISVNWNPYEAGEIYYRLEIFSANMSELFFMSKIQRVGCSGLMIKMNTAGDVNLLNRLKTGDSYVVRLTALLYEPGIDQLNDAYSSANVQAVSYFTKSFIWE